VQLTNIATEQTTAATDVLLALTGLLGVSKLARWRLTDSWKAGIWTVMFAAMASGAILGAVAHGLELEASIQALLWKPLNAALGLAVGFFALGAAHERWGKRVTRRLLPVAIGLGVVFFILSVIWPKTFLLFILYETSAMAFALAVYAIRVTRGHSPGDAWMLAGVALTMIAAVFQATRGVVLWLIWPFDHNGLFHLIQIAAVSCLLTGLELGFRQSVKPRSY
jgi:hypothetical protein